MTKDLGLTMGSLARSVLLAALSLLASLAAASGSIELTAYPGVSVADGRSTIAITAQVRDSGGQMVPDGTIVIFATTLGQFRETQVETQNGFARVALEASSIPGTGKVTASVLKFAATNSIEVLFVGDRSLLSSASDYIEIVGPRDMAYSLEDKTIQASGEGQGVHLRYRDITIEADDIELTVPNYEVKARNAKLTMGDKSFEMRALYMRLNQRKGIGQMNIVEKLYRFDRSWFLALPQLNERERLATVEINATGVAPSTATIYPGQLEFKDISEALTIVEAKKAIAYPSREVDFYRADVIVGQQKIMSLPLYRVSTHPTSPIVTEQYVQVSQNNLGVDYPYYLDLRPGQTSLLRLRHGRNVGSGIGLTGGTSLDYEFNWNKGADMDGGLYVRGLARNDWGLGMRQFWRPNSTTSISSQIDFPAHRSMFANLNISSSFIPGFQTNLSASHGQGLTSTRFRNNQYSAIIEKDPIRLDGLNARLFIGLNASQTEFSSDTETRTQNRAGVRARFIGDTIRLGSGQALNFSYTVGGYSGSNLASPFTHQATMALTTTFKNGLYLQTNYDFVQDGITDFALGQHRLSTDAYYRQGNWGLRGFASKSIDVQRLNASLGLDYRASSLWRINYGYYIDQYLGDSFLDQTVVVAYRLGFREIGISYSQRRQRLGIEILGTTFN
jgi:hypothetical protein